MDSGIYDDERRGFCPASFFEVFSVLPLLISVLLLTASQDARRTPYLLEVDGQTLGVFDVLTVTETADFEARLELGWMGETAFRALLGNAASVVEIKPGNGALPAGDRLRQTITFRQEMSSGLRRRSRSLVLIEACPVAWEIESLDSDTQRIHFKSIAFVAREIAAEF